jgi:hypothetical protein
MKGLILALFIVLMNTTGYDCGSEKLISMSKKNAVGRLFNES